MTLEFRTYRDPAEDLDSAAAARFAVVGLSASDQEAVLAMLAPLGAKREAGRFHRDHCLRVGLLAADIARHEGASERALLLAGLLHDVGKALVPACTLCATERWTAEDRAAMEPHVADGFRMLRDRFDFTAQVILWHHRFQGGGYPAEAPPGPSPPFSEETLALIRQYGALLMVADVYDAMHRVNSATGGVGLSDEEIRVRMETLPVCILGGKVHHKLIQRLYADGVLR